MSELMTTETTTEVPNTDADLEAVENVLFGRESAPKEDETPPPEPEAAEQTEEVGESEADDEADTEEASDEAPKPKKRTTADRIKKLAMDKARLAEEVAAMKAQIELLAGVKKPLTEDKAPATDTPSLVRPDPEKYQYGTLDDKYLEDLADYKAAVRLQEFQAKLEKDQQTKAEREAAERASATLQKTAADIETAGAAKFEDFRERVVEGGQNGDYALTKEMFETLAEVPDVAPDILYYLASYPEESVKVAQMSPRQQAMWFGRIEAEIRSVAKETPKPAARKATAAPPPPPAIPRGAGTGGGGVKLDDLEDPRALEAIEKLIFKQKG